MKTITFNFLNILKQAVRPITQERGNLSLEHILFIVAVAGLGGAVAAFYTDIGAWFGSISLPSAPSF